VRNSCDILDKNSLFAWLASCALSVAALSSSSAFFFSVRSHVILPKPTN
jgi:hypothetical protein